MWERAIGGAGAHRASRAGPSGKAAARAVDAPAVDTGGAADGTVSTRPPRMALAHAWRCAGAMARACKRGRQPRLLNGLQLHGRRRQQRHLQESERLGRGRRLRRQRGRRLAVMGHTISKAVAMGARVGVEPRSKVLCAADGVARGRRRSLRRRNHWADGDGAVGTAPASIAHARTLGARALAHAVPRAVGRARRQLAAGTTPSKLTRTLGGADATAVRAAARGASAHGLLALWTGPAVSTEAHCWRGSKAVAAGGVAHGACW